MAIGCRTTSEPLLSDATPVTRAQCARLRIRRPNAKYQALRQQGLTCAACDMDEATFVQYTVHWRLVEYDAPQLQLGRGTERFRIKWLADARRRAQLCW